MSVPSRVVLPETLDMLDPLDPRARRSRRDLRRVHRAMRTVSILKQSLRRLPLARPPHRILELGGGDASLMLRLARALQPGWSNVDLTILDLHDIVSPETRRSYEALGWRLQVVRQDVLTWATEPTVQRYDLCVTNLFLHHFDAIALPRLLGAIAKSCDAFLACEPRRNAFAAVGSAMIGLLGANKVTREDAVTSVAAGFTRQELSAMWPVGEGGWTCQEHVALPFTHCFTAVHGVPDTGAAVS